MSDTPDATKSPSLTGSVMGFPAYGGRSEAIGEVHSRPHPPIEQPRALIQLAFMTEGGAAVDRAVLSELSRRLGTAATDLLEDIHQPDA